MRQIGLCETRERAERFAGFLTARGIEAVAREAAERRAGVWVRDEDARQEAERLFAAFRLRPEDPQYIVAAAPAGAALVAAATGPLESPRRAASVAWALGGTAPATAVLIALSVVVTVMAPLGSADALAGWLDLSTAAVSRGEVWRLVTPVFQHLPLLAGGLGFLHLLFNMIWLRQFGGLVESAKGTAAFLGLFAVIAVLSNAAQFAVVGPGFGGMSGVVYGLFGYIWVKSRREPWLGLHLDPTTVIFLMAWLLLCAAGLFGPVANWAHGAGLVTGAACAFAPAWGKGGRCRAP